jgi:hypothetical protein
MSQSKNSPQRTKGAVRRQEAIDLRLKGLTYDQIGRQMGVSKVRAYQLVQSALERLNQKMMIDAETLRRETVERLDRLIQVYTPLAEKGDSKSGNLLVRCLESKSRLFGLIKNPHDGPPPPKPMTEDELRWEGYRLGLCPKPDSLPPSSNGTASNGAAYHTTSSPTTHGGRF